MARIVIETGPNKGKVFDLPKEGAAVAGRDSASFVRITDSKVSREHLRFTFDGTDSVLEDRGSSNGTFVNGQRVERRVLRSGDLIRVGDTFLSFIAEPVDALVGKTIAGYLVEQRIGRGGMGTVYRALQLTLERTVAFKVLSPALMEDREFVVRFLAEARTAAKLDHSNIVKIYDVGEDHGCYFLSMEFMPWGSVQEQIDLHGALPVDRALRMAVDAARALVWASENSIVHRDIKPDNLLIGSGDVVKVADFGLAADERKSKTLYAGGKVLGTPAHMPPEQALGQKVDHRADIYALGSTLYTALSGETPYTGDSAVEVLVRKTKEPPRPLVELVPGLPREVARIVEMMMAARVEDRFQRAVEVHEDLQKALSRWKAGQTARPGGRSGAGRIAKVFRTTLKKLRGGKHE